MGKFCITGNAWQVLDLQRALHAEPGSAEAVLPLRAVGVSSVSLLPRAPVPATAPAPPDTPPATFDATMANYATIAHSSSTLYYQTNVFIIGFLVSFIPSFFWFLGGEHFCNFITKASDFSSIKALNRRVLLVAKNFFFQTIICLWCVDFACVFF